MSPRWATSWRTLGAAPMPRSMRSSSPVSSTTPTSAPRRRSSSMPEPQPLPQVHPVWEELEAAGPQVGIVIATEADREIISAACDELLEREITFELKVLSAHG